MTKGESLSLGKFEIMKIDDDHVWIDINEGEGGAFSATELEAVIEKFFWEKF